MPRDPYLGSGHMAYHRASQINLYLQTKFHSNRRNFLWTDGQMYVRTYGTYLWTDIETGFDSDEST